MSPAFQTQGTKWSPQRQRLTHAKIDMPKIVSTTTPTKVTWTEVVYSTLPNLHVLMVNGKEAGTIHKPHDHDGDKNAWRCFLGLGEKAQFLGHEWTKAKAKALVAKAAIRD